MYMPRYKIPGTNTMIAILTKALMGNMRKNKALKKEIPTKITPACLGKPRITGVFERCL
jgi:hypothetical protein